METLDATKTESLTSYQKMMRKSAGISRTLDARKLRKLRDDIIALQTELNTQLVEMEASVDSITDSLDRLAQKDDIKEVNSQVEKLGKVLGSVETQVEILLKA